LKLSDGLVREHAGERDGIMALPWTDLAGPPPKLTIESTLRWARPGNVLRTEPS
jgi:hypothetical protein